MKGLGILLVLFFAFSDCAFADTGLTRSFIGEWYAGSTIEHPQKRLPVIIRENSLECDGYSFYSQTEGNLSDIYVIGNGYDSPAKVNCIEFVNIDALLLYWTNKDSEEIFAYYFEVKSNNSAFGYEVWFDNEKFLFLEDEIYIKTQVKVDNRRKTEIEKIRYLFRENEVFLIEDDDYVRCKIIELSDIYAILANPKPVMYRNDKPGYNVMFLLRTSAVE